MAATIRVVLGVNDASKLALPTGIPGSVADLKEEIKRHFGLSGNFRLQYRDTEFDNEFVNLSCTSDIKDKSTVKIIYLTNDTNASLPHHEPTASPQGVDNTSLSSFSSTSDTDILSSPGSSASASSGSSLRSQPWPHTFPLPQFNYEVDVQLEKANLAFHNSGTLLCPSTKLKSAILESLASEIIKYKMYPSSADLDDVSQALITKHPCLKEQGSVSGYYGWKISLKYKMANYRTRLRGIGCPELSINAMKEKDGSLNHSPNQVKKPRKAEVNYCPGYPAGESKESLEAERQALLVEVKKKNQEQIKNKMERTFAYRRQEIIQDMPFITELRSRWPALFSEREVDAEFARITTVPLRSTFMFQLDRHTDNLLKVFRKKGGAAGQKIKVILAAMDKDPSIEKRRDCVLKAVSVYLNEDPQHLIKEYMDLDPGAKKDMEETMMGVYVIWHEGAEDTDQAEDVGIIIEGVEVLQGLRMCGMDVDLEDGGSGEGEKEEEFWIGEGVKMLPPPVAHSGGSAWGSRRGRCGCLTCGAGLILWNLCVVLACVLLLAVVFSVVLLPAVLLLYVGFLCHSRVLDSPSPICHYLDDNSCSALIILGFVMMSPLVVVAAAIFCGLLRRFRLLLLVQPLTRAWYRGRLLEWVGSIHAWV